MIIVLQVVLYAIVNVGNLGYVKALLFRAEILFYLSPAASHEFPGLAVIKYRVLRLRVVLLDSHDIQQLLDQSVHVLATSYRILDEVQSGVNTQRVAWIDLLAVLASEFSVLLQQLVQTRLHPVIIIKMTQVRQTFTNTIKERDLNEVLCAHIF